MKIIFLSDIHGKFEALSSLPNADLVLFGGDFTTFGTDADVKKAIDLFASHFPNFIGVTGNMDAKSSVEVLRASGHLAELETPTTACGKTIRGICGSNKSPFNSPHEWEEDAMLERIAKLPTNAADIFITHAPPFESGADKITSGAYVGSRAIAELVKKYSPALLLCGHIHEAAGIYTRGDTIIVNPGQFGDDGNYAEIEWKDGAKPSVWLTKAK